MPISRGADPNVAATGGAGDASASNQVTEIARLSSLVAGISGTVSVSGAVATTGTVSVSGNVGVSGFVSVSNSVAVTGTFFQTVQPISGTVSVSGAVSGVQSISGTVGVTGPLTDTQLRASSVPVSGTVSVSGSVGVTGPLTDTQLRASNVPISGSVSVSGLAGVTGTVSVSGLVGVTGTVSVSGTVTVGTHSVNQGAASAVAWPVFTSQAVSGVFSVSGAVSGVQSISGTVGVNQGAASATAWNIQHVASHSAAQGASVYFTNVQSNTVLNVKASSGVVYGYTFYNPNQTVPAFVQFHKVTAASVGLSSAVGPYFTVVIPSAAAVSRSFQTPIAFASGIAIVATVSNSGSTANAIAINALVDFA